MRTRKTDPEPGPEKAFAAALRRLSQRMQSEGELRDALTERGYALDDTEAALAVLRESRYLDDGAYAETLLQRYRKKSRPAAIAALRAHKLSQEIIAEAMVSWEPDGEALTALLKAALQRECPDWEPGEDCPPEAARKAFAKLYRRGFSRAQIDSAFSALRTHTQGADLDETGEQSYEP